MHPFFRMRSVTNSITSSEKPMFLNTVAVQVYGKRRHNTWKQNESHCPSEYEVLPIYKNSYGKYNCRNCIFLVIILAA